jgi:acyl-CoA synthetase (AMP-forming)/AMP-acid ligase II
MWLAALLHRHRFHEPDRVAVIDDRRAFTFGELADRADALAASLRDRGVRRGDRVLVLSRNRAEMIESYVALARLGAVVVPINHGLLAPEVEHIVTLTGAVGALGERELLERALGRAAVAFAWDLDGADYQRAVGCGRRFTPPDVALDDAVAVLCTSATTGLPKGVVLTHRTFQHQALSWLATTGHSRDTVYLAAPPLFHSTVTVPLAYLAIGASVVLRRTFTPQGCLEAIAAHRVTHAYLVPSMISYLLRAHGLPDAELSSLREVFHGAAPMSVEQRLRAATLLGCALRDCYGQAEAGGPVTLGEPLRDPPEVGEPLREPPEVGERMPWQSAGRPLFGFEVRVVDERGGPLAAGLAGQIAVRSPATMRGYWQDEQATGGVLRHGWLLTGDVGTVERDGELRVIDRLTDLIIRGGQNVYPAEIERVLRMHPQIEDAAVVGVPDDVLGEAAVACIVVADGAPPTPAEALAFTVEHLASYKRPRAVTVVAELPRNPAGKVLKRVLREQLLVPERPA